MLEFLRWFDSFGVFLTFRVKDQDTYRSRFGGGIFILYILFSLSYFTILFTEFYNREIFDINYSNPIHKSAPRINLTNSGLYLAYAMQFDNGSFPDDSFYNIFKERTYVKKVYNSDFKNQTVIKADNKNCSYNDFNNMIDKKTFQNLNLRMFKCAVLTDDYFIQGTFTDELFQYVSFEISIKNKFFEGHDNKTLTEKLGEIGQILSNSPLKVIIYWTDTAIDSRKMKDPISSVLKSYITYMDYDLIKNINFDFSIMNYTTDSHYILRKPSIYENITYYDSTENSLECLDRLKFGELGKKMIKVHIRSSQYSYLIERTYMKLSTFLANFGALQTNIFLILRFVVGIFNKFRLEQMVLNKIFKYREHFKFSHTPQLNLLKTNYSFKNILNEEDITILRTENRSSKFKRMVTLIPIRDFKKTLDTQIEMTKMHLNNPPIEFDNDKPPPVFEQILGQTKKPLNFSSLDIILRLIPCRSIKLDLKTRLFNKAFRKMEYYFDVFTYVRKLQEIDVLKYLLLDKNQTKVFKFLCRPTLSITYRDSDSLYQETQQNREIKSKIKMKEVEDMIEAHNKISDDISQINKRLLYLFE